MMEGKWALQISGCASWPGAHLSQLRNRAAEGGTGGSVEKLPGPKDPCKGSAFHGQGLHFYPLASSSGPEDSLHGPFHGSQLCAWVELGPGLTRVF